MLVGRSHSAIDNHPTPAAALERCHESASATLDIDGGTFRQERRSADKIRHHVRILVDIGRLETKLIQAARARFFDIGRAAGLEWIVKLQREPAGDGPLLGKGVRVWFALHGVLGLLNRLGSSSPCAVRASIILRRPKQAVQNKARQLGKPFRESERSKLLGSRGRAAKYRRATGAQFATDSFSGRRLFQTTGRLAVAQANTDVSRAIPGTFQLTPLPAREKFAALSVLVLCRAAPGRNW
jgi:hypothetical protein